CKVGRADPSPTLKLEAWNSSQKDVPQGPWSFSAVELAFQVRKKPAYSGIKELPPWLRASVTRRMRDPNVGSLMTELTGPRAGARGPVWHRFPNRQNRWRERWRRTATGRHSGTR